MESIITALIAAGSAICVALINTRIQSYKKQKAIDTIKKDLHVDIENIYIYDLNLESYDKNIKHKSHGSSNKKIIILK
jgi:ribosomal protein L24